MKKKKPIKAVVPTKKQNQRAKRLVNKLRVQRDTTETGSTTSGG